ncbi:MAG: hypothetical protein IPN85_13365 [Flavobacteriales bacterium]|nr:hypothetical protein [Flavobacteriales bacterium]
MAPRSSSAGTRLPSGFHAQSVRCGFDIPPNVFGPGLSIAHRGTIRVHPDARIGPNCRIHVDVGRQVLPGPDDLVPTIGENGQIGPGAKLFGNIHRPQRGPSAPTAW